MKFQLTNEQVIQLTEIVDIVLRQHGLRVLTDTIELIAMVGKPIEKTSEYQIFEIDETLHGRVMALLDSGLKITGLSGATTILQLAQAFSFPLAEPVEAVTEVVAKEDKGE